MALPLLMATDCNNGNVNDGTPEGARVFPIEPPSGMGWCRYEIIKISEKSERLMVGAEICLICTKEEPRAYNNQQRCYNFDRLVYGAFEMEVKKISQGCESCLGNNFFKISEYLD